MKKSAKAKTSPAPATPLTEIVPPAAQPVSAAPAPKPVKAAPAAAPKPIPATVITAAVDVGFGNALYIRGDGPGLNWNKGILLDCVGNSEWKISIPGARQPVVVKFLLNDETWSAGENFTVTDGTSATFTPTF